MATKDDKKKAAPAAPAAAESTALATQGAQGLSTAGAQATFGTLAGYGADDKRGKEGITGEDMKLPFLAQAQKTSKALDSTEDSYIDGLEFGDMYNTETKQILGKGPIRFIPLRHRKRAYLPDDNGRMGETIEWGDERCAWPTEEQKKAWKGKGKPKPEGVRVYDWVVLLMLEDGPQLVVVSFKSKSFGAGQSLTTFVNMVKGPAFTGQYRITSVLDSNDSGKFAKFAVSPAGKPTVEEAQFAESVYESVKDRNIAVDDPLDHDDAPAAGGPAANEI